MAPAHPRDVWLAVVALVAFEPSSAAAQEEAFALAAPEPAVNAPGRDGGMTSGERGWLELGGGLCGFALAALAVEGWMGQSTPVSFFDYLGRAGAGAALYSAGVLTGIAIVGAVAGGGGNLHTTLWAQLAGSILAGLLAASEGPEVVLLGLGLIAVVPGVFGYELSQEPVR